MNERPVNTRHQSEAISKYIDIPGTQMTSIFEGQPPKTRPFPIKTRDIWVPGYFVSFFFQWSFHFQIEKSAIKAVFEVQR